MDHIFAPNAPSSETPQLQFRSLSLRRARSKGLAPWCCGLDHGIRGHEFFVDYMLYHMDAHIQYIYMCGYICVYVYVDMYIYMCVWICILYIYVTYWQNFADIYASH